MTLQLSLLNVRLLTSCQNEQEHLNPEALLRISAKVELPPPPSLLLELVGLS